MKELVKELVLVGSKSAVNGNGYFMGDFADLEVSVKDSHPPCPGRSGTSRPGNALAAMPDLDV